MKLTDEMINTARPGVKPTRLTDGHGLYVLLSPTGGKWWRFKYRFSVKQKQFSLGVYPKVSIAEARAKHTIYRAMLAEGTDPCAYVQAEKAERKAELAAELAAEKARQLARSRFMLDSSGNLSLRLGKRRIVLSAAETADLRSFLNTNQNVISKVTPCP
jgi:hypothetical protein